MLAAMFRTSIHARRTKAVARVMVLVWIFGLMVSLANACVLDGGGVRVSAHGLDPGVAAASAGHERAGGTSDRGPSPAKAACLDFCDQAQSTVLKAQASNFPDAAALPMLFVDSWPAPPTRAAAAVTFAVVTDPPPDRAVAIRFLRLTL
jgi:hypothetical protein